MVASSDNSQQGPHSTREETLTQLESLLKCNDPDLLSRVYGPGTLLMSAIPPSCLGKNTTINMGVDEAGRGPLLGPMVYAAAYWSTSPSRATEALTKTFRDSKTLTAKNRTELLELIKKNEDVGFVIRILHANEISRNMLRYPTPYNLNEMSHDAVIQMIHAVSDAGLSIENCFVDTVGHPQKYRDILEKKCGSCGNVNFVVEAKADGTYPPCSAASVVAKVTRDEIIENWKWREEGLDDGTKVVSKDFGSGYPSDPKCKTWLSENHLDGVFGYPDVVRFSWGPAVRAVDEKGVKMEWPGDDEENEKVKNQPKVCTYFSSGGEKEKKKVKRRRLKYFESTGLEAVSELFKM